MAAKNAAPPPEFKRLDALRRAPALRNAPAAACRALKQAGYGCRAP
ncbi:MAG: hypothetical protein JJU00_15310 [Opitutales bacterium]|nr:hypothetical protein [Opitutales bacterium]